MKIFRSLYPVLLSTIILYLFCTSLKAQPVTNWSRLHGRTDTFEKGTSVLETLDGGFFITSSINSDGRFWKDVWLIRTNEWGDTLWTKIYKREGRGDFGLSAVQTSDGGFVILAQTNTATSINSWLLKTDVNGDTLWTKMIGGPNTDLGEYLIQTPDGGFAFIGYTSSWGAGDRDVWVVKTDALFNVVWMKTFGGENRDMGHQIRSLTDGGFIIVGENTTPDGHVNAWLIRIDDNGNVLWERKFRKFLLERGLAVRQTMDDGFITANSFLDTNRTNWSEIWLIKTDSSGDTLWTKIYGRSASDRPTDLEVMDDKGFLILGVTRPLGFEPFDYWVIRVDSIGDTLWTKLIGGPGHEQYPSFARTSDGGIIITGYSGKPENIDDKDVWLVKLGDPQGRIVVGETIAEFGDTLSIPLTVTLPLEIKYDSASIYLTGFGGDIEFIGLDTANSLIGRYDWRYTTTLTGENLNIRAWSGESISGKDIFFYLKLYVSAKDSIFIPIVVDSAYFNDGSLPIDLESGGVNVIIRTGLKSEELTKSFFLSNNFPNPFNPSTAIVYFLSQSGKVKLNIYNILGEKIIVLVDKKQESGFHLVHWDASEVPSGIYLYRLDTGSHSETKKMLLIK